ncbi:alpha/beta hydrolase [Roseomonas sp. OT10]|uniref:alpha/beta fold hydrolase n=1 Tax=Roseomonas cutis TaxID=2897332 RepID=UPI001E47FE66|nr:alpha/beta fold hydrolase [Roseomonas sp. OT10]UFN49032.1 alpha/beta hydrolase [Roseomonas sp. OT10]
MRRRTLLAALLPAGCAPEVIGAGPVSRIARMGEDWIVAPDGAVLPLRAWQPAGVARAAILALHGFNDSRNFMVEPAEALTAAGIAVYAYDQRGFGAAPHRGIWAGGDALAADAATAARLVRARHPAVPLILLGESMGGAVAMLALASDDPPPVDGAVLLAPAVWGRETMPGVMRWLVEAMAHAAPQLAVSSGVPGISPTDNLAALRRWARDPLTLLQTRMDATLGLLELMDAAALSGARLTRVPVLLVYGGRDRLVPPQAVQRLLGSLPPGNRVRVAYYPPSYHFLLRDLNGPVVTQDLVAWIGRPDAPLPSGADRQGETWLQSGRRTAAPG